MTDPRDGMAAAAASFVLYDSLGAASDLPLVNVVIRRRRWRRWWPRRRPVSRFHVLGMVA